MSMRRRLSSLAGLVVAASLGLGAPHAAGAPPDPAARGLDAFIESSPTAIAGAPLPLQLETFGFPLANLMKPLAGVQVDAAWDPESLGPNVATAPPAVSAKSDADGHVTLAVPVPQGEPRELKLLVGLRYGGHARTRELTVRRSPTDRVQLHVADRRVVPGSTLTSWVTVRSAADDSPEGQMPVELALREGTYARATLHAVTDASGTAVLRVPVPTTDDPSWTWNLVATVRRGDARSTSEVTLVPRDETPGLPEVRARFDAPNVDVGKSVGFTVTLRDGSGEPIADLPLRYWLGPTGTKAPTEEKAWIAASRPAKTSTIGEVHGTTDAPRVVAIGASVDVQLVVRTSFEGRELTASARVPVSASAAYAELHPESQRVVPGLEQRMLLVVRDGHDDPITGRFRVEGDGLAADVTTDASGEAEVTWKPPADLGARRDIGPCAGGVAASVRVRATSALPALATHPEPFALCVEVDRDDEALVRLDRTIARLGGEVHVRAVARDGSRGPWSVTVRDPSGEIVGTRWMDDGDKGVDVPLRGGAAGVWTVEASEPHAARASRLATTALMVLPTTLPRIAAKITGGRAVPNGTVEVDATVTDDAGKPLVGTVAAVLTDLEGGGSLAGLEAFDTRAHLCSDLGAGRDRCDAALSADPPMDAFRRGRLGDRTGLPPAPLHDPGASLKTDLDDAFSQVLRSLEGAVYQSTSSPDDLQDVRRKGPGGFVFNPELLTLTTAAMDRPPRTPGGEPIVLGDLLAIDPQVTFDNVARRVTRLKLFRVLTTVRTYKMDNRLSDDEPVFGDPNALLRRLVRQSSLTQDQLLDPWGGTMQFVKSATPAFPFLGAVRGWELRSPGPDGRLGTGDDVRDPFGRVLRSDTPYARAVEEDRIVDAKYDVQVADATVSAWRSLLEAYTGTSLGLSGIGEGGGGTGEGVGFGSGYGTLGHGAGTGRVRTGSALSTGDAFFAAPQRTDAQGHVHFSVPLGAAETTWGLGLVALPDHAPPATAMLKIPAALPVSASVYAGDVWTEGDEVAVRVAVRNRTAAPLRATLDLSSGGVASVVDRAGARRTLDVPAAGVAYLPVRMRAGSVGQASLQVHVSAPGQPDDATLHTWEVMPYAEPITTTTARWVDGSAEVEVQPASGQRLTGQARLVLSRGFGDVIDGALEALDADRLTAPASLADAAEAASRIDRFAVTHYGEGSALHARATSLLRRASGRLGLQLGKDAGRPDAWVSRQRLMSYAPEDLRPKRARGDAEACPPTSLALPERVAALDVAPTSSSLPCWETFVSETASAARDGEDLAVLARAVIALVQRGDRALLAASLAERLRAAVGLQASGAIRFGGSRADRATVYAALLVSNPLGRTAVATDRLSAWIAVDRDASGSFGSTAATLAVVRALLGTGLASAPPTRVTVTADGGAPRTVTVPASGTLVMALGARTTRVGVETQGPGIVARLERPLLRSFDRSPDASSSPLRVDVTWPGDARAGKLGTLHLAVRTNTGAEEELLVRVPLPPGAGLAEPEEGVKQLQGSLVVRRRVASYRDEVVDVPLRFTLAGSFRVPEGRVYAPLSPIPRGIAPARPLVVR